MKIEHSRKRKDSNYMLVCIEYNPKEIEKAEMIFDILANKNYRLFHHLPIPKGYIYIELDDCNEYDQLLNVYKKLKNKRVNKK